MSIKTGDLAPDFELVNQFGEKVSLSSFRGKKNVLLVFFPFAFTGTCTTRLVTNSLALLGSASVTSAGLVPNWGAGKNASSTTSPANVATPVATALN